MPVTYYTKEDLEQARRLLWETVLSRVAKHQEENEGAAASAIYRLRKELTDFWYGKGG